MQTHLFNYTGSMYLQLSWIEQLLSPTCSHWTRTPGPLELKYEAISKVAVAEINHNKLQKLDDGVKGSLVNTDIPKPREVMCTTCSWAKELPSKKKVMLFQELRLQWQATYKS